MRKKSVRTGFTFGIGDPMLMPESLRVPPTRGNSMAAIAERLVISENTVRTHAKHTYTKLDIHRRQELLDMLRELGD